MTTWYEVIENTAEEPMINRYLGTNKNAARALYEECDHGYLAEFVLNGKTKIVLANEHK